MNGGRDQSGPYKWMQTIDAHPSCQNMLTYPYTYFILFRVVNVLFSMKKKEKHRRNQGRKKKCMMHTHQWHGKATMLVKLMIFIALSLCIYGCGTGALAASSVATVGTPGTSTGPGVTFTNGHLVYDHDSLG